MKDPLGEALLAYQRTGKEQKVKVYSKEVSTDEYPASYFFRSFKQMPKLEQIALKECSGQVLDVGAGAGCHSLWLRSQGFDVTSVDNSPGCVLAMNNSGLEKTLEADIQKLTGQFDTILLLMNGIGLSQRLSLLPSFLKHLRTLLKDGGQIIADSSSIFHLYEELSADEFLSFDKDYLGEVEFQFAFAGNRGDWFPWIYVDEATLRENAEQCGFDFRVLYKSPDKSYLVRLSKA